MAQLLYIHGSGYTEESFKAQSEAFGGSDAVTLPGHPGGEAFETVEEASAWFARYVQWRHAGRAIAVGNSLGGAIALRWALDFPDQAAGLVLIGTGAKLRVSPHILQMVDESWPACIDTLVDLAVSPSASTQLRARMRAWHLAVGQESTRRDYVACDRFDVIAELSNLKLPTLIIVGSLDRLTPPKYATYLNERIAGSTLAIVEGAGHVVMAERPEAVNRSIAEFLASLPGA
jgi:pimeloyl-ACP methyl ester carboxylesterase